MSVRSPSDIVKRWYNSYASQKDLARRKLLDTHDFIRNFGNEVNARTTSKTGSKRR